MALRAWTAVDLPAVVAASRDPDTQRFLVALPERYEEHHAFDWLETHERSRRAGTGLELAVADAASDRVLGAVSMQSVDWLHHRAELGYWVVPAERGRHVATRALDLVAGWAFRALAMARLHLYVDPDNHASQHTATGAGFRQEAILHSHMRDRSGTRRDSLVYVRLAPV